MKSMKCWRRSGIVILICTSIMTGCGLLGVTPWTGNVKVTGLTATQGTYPLKIVLSWDAVEGAVGYGVYMAQAENAEYEQMIWMNSGTSVEVYLNSDYYQYWYDLYYGRQYWFRVQAMVMYEGGIGYSEMSDSVMGYTDPEVYAGTWNFENRTITFDGTNETVTAGYRKELSIDAAAMTIKYIYYTYNITNGSYDAAYGARFSFSEVLFPNQYSATVELVDLRQTHYLDTGSGNFVSLTSTTYNNQTGGVLSGLELDYRPDTGLFSLEFGSYVEFDVDNDGYADWDFASGDIFYRSIGT